MKPVGLIGNSGGIVSSEPLSHLGSKSSKVY